MFAFLVSMLACFPEIQKEAAERFPENPTDDYDEDGFMDAEDCDDSNPDITVPQTYYRDADGDGFGVESDSVLSCTSPEGYIEAKVRNGVAVFDCNDDPEDNGSAFYPDAEEVCDELDNDCDNDVDEDITTAPIWYLDNDNDGYGDIDQTLKACHVNGGPPAGYVENSADCDDGNGLAFPNADELCNEIDDNCNGVVDEATAADAPLWYADADGDGFGSVLNVVPSCTQPSIESSDGSSVTYVSDNTDCNDSSASVSPDGTEVCDAIDNDCDGFVDEGSGAEAPEGSPTFYADNDGDGYGVDGQSIVQCDAPTGFVGNADDCDDFDTTVNPGATETCNEVDDNCDGTVDEAGSVGEVIFFLDADGDGFGISGQFQSACTVPSGYAPDLGDCDDTDAAIYPTAIEVCDEIDNNCDALVDDADPAVVYATSDVWYADADGDGFGIASDTIQQCDLPQGYIDNADDCNDNKSFQYPGAPELCNNQDDDCDGVVDNSPVDETEWFTDADGDGHGALVDVTSISTEYPNGYDLLACPAFDPNTGLPQFQPGYSRFNNDCNDLDASISPSANELCTQTIDENCDGNNIAGATDFNTYVVDFDLDGYGNSTRRPNGELIYSFQSCVKPLGYIQYRQGDVLDCNDADIEVHPDGTIEHTHALPGSGSVTHTLSERINGKVDLCENDWNGDLTPPQNEWDDDGDGYVEGVIDSSFLYNSDGTVNGWESSQTIYGGGDCDDTDNFAYPRAVELCNGAVENFRGDGLCDEVVPFDEIDDDGDCFVECTGFDTTLWEGGTNTCEYVDDLGQLVQETVVVGGDDCNDSFSQLYPRTHPDTQLSTCFADYDGDGYPDRDWAFCNTDLSIDDSEITILGGSGRFGLPVQSAGDVDGDGLDDILVGALYNSDVLFYGGAVYLFLGSTLTTMGSFDASQADFTFYGTSGQGYLGAGVSSAGDVDGDGLDDIMFSSTAHDSGKGIVYLFLGSSLTTPGVMDVSLADYSFVGQAEGDKLGASITSVGDVDQDGLSDLLLSAPFAETSAGISVGKSYLIRGASLGQTGLWDIALSDMIFEGATVGESAGKSTSRLGDIDGDGLDEILIGAPNYAGSKGRTYIVLSSSLQTPGTLSLSNADFIIEAQLNHTNFGTLLAAGDVNGGGLPDIAISAPYYDERSLGVNGQNLGKVAIFFGENLTTPGTYIMADADLSLLGDTQYGKFGTILEIAEDLDGDGFSDLLAGSYDSNSNGNNSGSVYIFMGGNLPLTGDVSLSSRDFTVFGNENDRMGQGLGTAGDINGDGLTDIIVGAPDNRDSGGSYYGNGKVTFLMACEQ